MQTTGFVCYLFMNNIAINNKSTYLFIVTMGLISVRFSHLAVKKKSPIMLCASLHNKPHEPTGAETTSREGEPVLGEFFFPRRVSEPSMMVVCETQVRASRKMVLYPAKDILSIL